MSSASEEAKSKKQKDIEDYLSKIKLREVFQVIFPYTRMRFYCLGGSTCLCAREEGVCETSLSLDWELVP